MRKDAYEIGSSPKVPQYIHSGSFLFFHRQVLDNSSLSDLHEEAPSTPSWNHLHIQRMKILSVPFRATNVRRDTFRHFGSLAIPKLSKI